MARSSHTADPTRTAAFVTGIFYLITFAASIPAALMLAPILTDPAYIVGPGADQQILLACLLDLVNALACIGSAVAVFSVLRRHQETLALGFVATRMLEAAVIVTGIVSLLAVVTIRETGPAAGTDRGSLIAVGQGLVGVRDWTFILGPSLMPAFNALMLATVLYRARMVPRVIPALGLIGAPLLIASTAGIILGYHELGSAWSAIATAPIFIWELSVGLWMTFKGFDREASIPGSTGTDIVRQPAAAASMRPVPSLFSRFGRPAPHRLWLAPGLATGVAAAMVSEHHHLGLIPVLVFSILPHAAVILGWGQPRARGHIGRRAVPLFNALHEPLVPAAIIVVGLAGVGGPTWLVAGLAWLGHIVVDLGLGDGLRDPDGGRWGSGPLGSLARLIRSTRTHPAV